MSDLANRILACIRELATNRAITDTIWLGDRGITVCEELSDVAIELGADADEVVRIFSPPRG
jgi:aminoglycoside phosphotransferase family enzyme